MPMPKTSPISYSSLTPAEKRTALKFLLRGMVFADFDFVPGAAPGHWAGEKGLIMKGECPVCSKHHFEPMISPGAHLFHLPIGPTPKGMWKSIPYVFCPTLREHPIYFRDELSSVVKWGGLKRDKIKMKSDYPGKVYERI